MPDPTYDAALVLSFGGPEGPDDVIPFLEQVTRGRGVPHERLLQVARQYDVVGGVSPINGANRAMVAGLTELLASAGPAVPVFWGNRNWHPFLADTLRDMADRGIRRAACFVTSAYAGQSSCRQYLDDIARARAEVGRSAPVVDKLRPYFDHPGFVEPFAEKVAAALQALPADLRAGAHLVFSAHSVPAHWDSAYVEQLRVASGLIAGLAGAGHPWELVFQSRSGAPGQEWLGPDVSDHLERLAAEGAPSAVVVPVGFLSDHMEVVYDLDVLAAGRAAAAGLTICRAATPGDSPRFLSMIRELILERIDPAAPRLHLSGRIPDLDCSPGCCPPPAGRTALQTPPA